MIYLVDLEASSLSSNGFPIELAWVDAQGQGESFLIRPTEAWLSDGCPGWSAESEAVHGLSLATLLRKGLPVDEVAARAAAVLASGSATVFSDAPGHDAVWLADLLHVGGQPVGVHFLDVRQLYGWACRPLLAGLDDLGDEAREQLEKRVRQQAHRIVAQAEEEEGRRPRVRHRALSDAYAMWRTWRRIVAEVARLSGQTE